MKVISKEGFKFLEKKFKAKVQKGYLEPRVVLYIDEEYIDNLCNLLNNYNVEYDMNFQRFEIKQEELVKVFSDKFLEEDRFWVFNSNSKILRSKEMSQQQLSNCIMFLEILLTLNMIYGNNADYYLKNLEENIIPELSERFEGVVLDYVPENKTQEDLYKRCLKIQKNGKGNS